MKEIKLFKDAQGNWLTNLQLLDTLRGLGADQCKILFVHTSLSFGMPNPELKKREMLQALLDVLYELHVPTLVMPTFTFSYPNGKDYDPLLSKTKMGALNEYFRKQPSVIRSLDPLMSVAVKGEDTALATEVSTHSISAGSTYDMLRHRDGVKFMFLGTKIGDCFTYMHYLEWLYEVDYRYIRQFRGYTVLNGERIKTENDLFVRYSGAVPNDKSYEYEEDMYKAGIAHKATFGDSTISIVDEKPAAEAYKQCLIKNPHYFITLNGEPYHKDRTFVLEHEMVAL